MNLSVRKSFLPIAKPIFGKAEKKEIIDTLDSGWITLGPKTEKFEQALTDYLGVKYVIALNSCSAALHLAMLAINLGPEDEVITTTFTFAATAHAIIHCGAKPVFVDIDPKNFNIDPQKIEASITKKTKAILPVHYGGYPVEINAIKKLAKKYNLYLIDDAAFAIGAKYNNKFIGTIGDLTCFSFHPVKIISTGDGGAISTNNKALAEKLMVLRVNGMDKEAWKRNTPTGKWDYSITLEGYKYNMTDLQASLGIHQLEKIEKFLKIREQISKIYDQRLQNIKEITLPYTDPKVRQTRNLYPILLDTSKLNYSRNQIMEELRAFNIGTNVFFRPLHLQPFFRKKFGFKEGLFPVSEYVFERLICIPIHAGMNIKDALYVSKVLKIIIEKGRKKK